MAKKKTRRQTSPSGTPKELQRTLNRLDRELLKLLNQRAKTHRQLDATGELASSTSRDAIERAVESNKGPLPEQTIEAVFRELRSGCQSLKKKLKVAYLGPPYSYSHVAAIKRFGQSHELIPVGTIAAVFESLNRNQCQFGIVPIENSTDGRVADTLDMFARMPIKICGEGNLRIHHFLLSRSERAEINEIYSKPQALSQCREWLALHMPGVRLVEMTSTAAAARLATEKGGAAAIASLQAGVHYGLQPVAANIEDNKHNITRFAIIGDETPTRTGCDKTSLMFQISHQSGALADVMSIFKRSRLNLTWIESFPMSGAPNEYLFFVELEGHQHDPKVKRSLASLERKTVRLNILGSYGISQAVE